MHRTLTNGLLATLLALSGLNNATLPAHATEWAPSSVVDSAYPDDGSTFGAEGSLYLLPATTDGHKVSIWGPDGKYDVVFHMRVLVNNNNVDNDDGQGRIDVEDMYWERKADGDGSLYGEIFLGPGQHTVRTSTQIFATQVSSGSEKQHVAPIIENTFTINQVG